MIRIFFFLLISSSVFSQTIDSTQVFSLEKYLTWVRVYHPVMQQANLLQNKADASLLEARGIFDPKWFGDYEDKSFDQKNYFRIGEAGLKIPTWFGIDVKMAYLWSNGQFLNPEGNLPSNGQAVLGIEVPLLQGLTFDQRRAQVQIARLLQEGNEAARRTIINDLFIKAIGTYWKWAYQNQILKIYENSLNLARDRFQLVKASFEQGDKPAIDTLESLIQIQNREIQYTQAQVDFRNATLDLSNFLWFENLTPLEVSEDLRPEDLQANWNFLEEKPNDNFLRTIADSHPELQSILVKQQQLDIKERLKREQFKPNLRLNYNFLGNGFDWTDDNSTENAVNNLVTENYKWGVKFSYPLTLRKERGGLELVRIEQLENQYKLGEKQLKITNKINAIYQQLETTFTQITTLESMVVNYETLLNAESEKFRIGESSIFLLNSREQKLIEAQMKLNKLQTEFQKLKWKLRGAKGQLQ
ncbi:MAG: TolC family protein [Saprospiraceae bacterium]